MGSLLCYENGHKGYVNINVVTVKTTVCAYVVSTWVNGWRKFRVVQYTFRLNCGLPS